MLGNICTFWNLKYFFQEFQYGGHILYMHNSCMIFPLLCWLPFSGIWLFFHWREQNWKVTFCSGKRAEHNCLWKICRTDQTIIVHPLLFCGLHILSRTQQPLRLNHLVLHNLLRVFLRGLSLFHLIFMKKKCWRINKNHHRIFKLDPSFLLIYGYERIKLEESLWKACENTCRCPDWTGKIQIIFPQFFNSLCMLLPQILSIL